MKKVLIVNAWGGNRGDEAMINVLSRLIKSVYDDVRVDLVPFRNEIIDLDPDIRQLPRTGNYFYSQMTPWLKKIEKILRKVGLPKENGLIKFMAKKINAGMSFIKDYDMVISSPQGPTISDLYTHKLKTLYPLAAAQKFGVPYFILGVSMGPFDDQSLKEEYVFKVLKGAREIIVREDISLDNVHKKYPSLNNVSSAIDFVYCLPPSLKNKPADILQQHEQYLGQIEDSSTIAACISLTAARSPKNKFDKEEYLKTMIAFFDHVLMKTTCKLLLIPHLNFDLPYLNRLMKAVKQPERMSIYPEIFDSDFQQDFMQRKCKFFISTRYHPTIFAVKGKVPFMCILNQFKTEGMLNKLDLDFERCWQDDGIDALKDTFDKCWNKRDEYKIQLREANQEKVSTEAAKYRELFLKYR